MYLHREHIFHRFPSFPCPRFMYSPLDGNLEVIINKKHIQEHYSMAFPMALLYSRMKQRESTTCKTWKYEKGDIQLPYERKFCCSADKSKFLLAWFISLNRLLDREFLNRSWTAFAYWENKKKQENNSTYYANGDGIIFLYVFNKT